MKEEERKRNAGKFGHATNDAALRAMLGLLFDKIKKEIQEAEDMMSKMKTEKTRRP